MINMVNEKTHKKGDRELSLYHMNFFFFFCPFRILFTLNVFTRHTLFQRQG